MEKEGAIKAQDFEKAAALRDKEKQTKEKLDTILNKWREEREEKEVVVTADDMMHIISKVTGVPLQRMEQEETQKLLMMEAELKQRVIGQDEAVTAISKALRRIARRLERSPPPDRFVYFPWPDRSRQNLSRAALWPSSCSAIATR